MPTINDATVVASAYDTSGNGGRKLVRLSNGWLVAGAWNSANNDLLLYKSTDNGNTWTQLGYIDVVYSGFFALSAVGTKVDILYGNPSYNVDHVRIDATTQTNVELSTLRARIDSSQSALGNVSLAINDTGTELHAAWASKNATYPNSFNIRYAKYDIAAGTWSAVEQVTTINNTSNPSYAINPTITLDKNGIPCITYSSDSNLVAPTSIQNSTPSIVMVKRSAELTTYTGFNTFWTFKTIYTPSANYVQSSPSAIFVPQSINGLANGRIWVAWHGKDATDTAANNIRVSYSDDGGVTWSTPTKITSGNVYVHNVPSITFNKRNQIYILWNGYVDSVGSYYTIYKSVYNGTSWSANTRVTNAASNATSPSTLVDVNLDYTEPLFIYSGVSKVGFYGTWTVLTISVTQGAIGQKTDKANLLTYSITTDGTMSTITEKVNGVTIGTKTATSGQSLIAGLTQAQWDAVRFGKYANATGGKNTLTIEMGSETFTYTFDKRPATDADVLSAVKAVKDKAEVVEPAQKAIVASAARSKGASVNDSDSWETIGAAVAGIALNKKEKSGTFTISGAAVAVTGLGFLPKILFLKLNDSYNYEHNSDMHPYYFGLRNASVVMLSTSLPTKNADGFTIPLDATNYPNGTWTYYAGE